MDEVNKNMDSREDSKSNKVEVDLIEIAKTIREGKKIILSIVILFSFIGLIIAFGTKVEYTSICKILPESQNEGKSSLGSLGGLAGLAGINLNMSDNNSLSPDLYPQIAQSLPFQLKLMHDKIYFEKYDTITTPYIYFQNIDKPSFVSLLFTYTVGLKSRIKNIFKKEESIEITHYKNELIRLTPHEKLVLEILQNRITILVDGQTNVITISCEMPDAVAAAKLTNLSVKLLTDFITNHKIEKSRESLKFVEARYVESKDKFEKSQEKLAGFNDQNLNVVTARARAELQRLQNENNLDFEVYKGLATQLEQAKIKVKEQTPVFSIIEPASVPFYKSKPNRKLIFVSSIFFGFIFGVVWLFISQYFIYFRKQFKERLQT